MSTITMTNYDSCELEDFQRFEKIRRRQRAIMPVHQSHTAIRASHRTPTSRRTSRRVSQRKSGIHHRRQRQTF
jgi:hypothetical protein